MRSTFVCVLTLLICNLVALTRPPAPLPEPAPRIVLEEQSLDDDSALLAPITFGALTLIPIVATHPTPGDDVLALDEAMRTHELRIREVDEGRVDALAFSNASDKPVFVLAGEVILGGKQDRVVATSTVIPPHTTQTVPVRCVEHGRWEGKTSEFTTAETLAHDRLRANATYGTQMDVWADVKQLNERNATTNGTDTYRTLAMRQAEDARSLERQIDDALVAVPQRARMIGYAIAYLGEVSAVDKFRSPALFTKLERKLLRSYIAQALEYSDRLLAFKEPCSHTVREFVDNAKSGEQERAFATNLASTLVKRGTVASTSWVDSGDRHLYANYLGNSRIAQPPPPASNWSCAQLGHGQGTECWREPSNDRHLYPNHLGNTHDRRLYPSYLGNAPQGDDRCCQDLGDAVLGTPPGGSGRPPDHCAQWLDRNANRCESNPRPRADRLRRTSEPPDLNCERSLYPSYLRNTRAWNECRRAKGLPVAGEANP